MDDLEFRRALYSEPNCKDPELLQAMLDDPDKQSLHKELIELDGKMQQAAQVEVPVDLAQKLIMRQTMQPETITKKSSWIQLAMAASIAFVFGVSFTMWQQHDLLNLADQAIAHVHYEGDIALDADNNVSLQQVNAKLAEFGGEFTQDLGQVHYARFCDYENVRSLHMVMQGDKGKVSVFVIPHDDAHKASGSAKDDTYHSQAIDVNHASIIVVGEEGTNIESMQDKIKQNIKFSI